jgi:hypothetical protein
VAYVTSTGSDVEHRRPPLDRCIALTRRVLAQQQHLTERIGQQPAACGRPAVASC